MRKFVVMLASVAGLGACGTSNRDELSAVDQGDEVSTNLPNANAMPGDSSKIATTGNASESLTPTATLIASSTPADGATVAAPVNELVLRFSPPARLGEVTVSGPDGLMPMMITAVGEVPTYTLPVSGLGTGRYTVTWKASAAGTEREGSFSFTVR